jgi:5'-nucleotidase (lipoprotein e(P4) family)
MSINPRIQLTGSLFLGVALLIGGLTATAQERRGESDHLEEAVLWQQQSGERRALSYQTFALARMILDRDLRANRSRRKRAIIVDVDDTVLDNSRYQANLIKTGKSFDSKTWTEWCNRAEAEAVPGAVDFLRYANSRGVRVFYITNRKQIEREGTARNLKRLGFPDVNELTLQVKPEGESSSKETRRQAVSAKYRVVMLMGDDLNDFSEVFEQSKTIASRLEATERNKPQFGARFIVLPNPMYGHWEDAIYPAGQRLTEEQKEEKRRAALKGW